MDAKEARENAMRIVELERKCMLREQIWEDEAMLAGVVEGAVRRGCFSADAQIDFSSVIIYDCGDIDCHIGKFHSKAEYVEKLINPYFANGYNVRYEYTIGEFIPYDGSIKCTPGQILKLEISW